MPIRFRCPKCEGLLSIARRKAGTQIVCPKCHDEVLVPSADLDTAEPEIDLADEGTIAESTTAQVIEPLVGEEKSASALFEKPDFAQSLIGTVPVVSGINVESYEIASVPIEDGIFITHKTAMILGLLSVVLLGLAFATGFLMGR